ncbi:SprT-like domain-containing protein [Pseudactinotalea sp. Z1739]|uniref:SprT-like domain-containing protein n=1 Tax=Pseudactinotalea sp. Z1739 TaxID=3413028 RepID=UPI003C7B5154
MAAIRVGTNRCSWGDVVNLEQAESMARDLMAEHGLRDWTFAFDRAKRRAGLCRFHTRTISLSRHLTELHHDDLVRDTVLHEIAHALAGPDAGHGTQWRQVAGRIGARPERTLPAEAPLPPAPWEGHCPGGHEHRRFRKPARPVSCSRCCPQFCIANLIIWTRDGEPMQPGPTYHRALKDAARRAKRQRVCRRCGGATDTAREPARTGRRGAAPARPKDPPPLVPATLF